MTSTFSGIGIALSALVAQRQAIDATGHNVANANTPGYSRQEVTLGPSPPLPPPWSRWPGTVGQVGTGVDVTSVRRMRDAFVDLQLRRQINTFGRWQASADVLRRSEAVLTEPSDTGLGNLLNEFWNAWDELGNSPRSIGARASLLGKASDLAVRFNHTYTQFELIRGEADERLGVTVLAANDVAREIAVLNGEIRNVQASGQQPNDLHDRRDLLLDKLAAMVSFQARADEYGAMTIHVGGTVFVDGTNVNEIAVDTSGEFSRLRWSKGGHPVDVQDGEMRGLIDARDVIVPRKLGGLERLAGQIIDAVNAVHAGGYGLDGSTGRDFFVYHALAPDHKAKHMAVNPDLVDNPNGLAAAAPYDPPPADPPFFAEGDGSTAFAVAGLRHAANAGLSGATVNNFYDALVVELGVESRQHSAAEENQQVVVDHLSRQREAFSGVSLDEEATNMVRFQQAYAAAAQYMSVVDDMLNRLINIVGAAGR